MALEKEARTNIMGSSLDIRNRNWGKVDNHMLETAEDNVHGLSGAVIVESGSNENGYYVMWGNGLMLTVVNFEQAITTSDIGVFAWAASRAHTFIKPFIKPPTFVGCACDDTNFASASSYSNFPTATQGRLNLYYRMARTSNTQKFQVTYIGQWK
ncbi:MAG TPA: hypothetical protein VFC75_03340 [Erysipelothrix sp.]|nr:hypothetical protein [Erysipelothrix sp.]